MSRLSSGLLKFAYAVWRIWFSCYRRGCFSLVIFSRFIAITDYLLIETFKSFFPFCFCFDVTLPNSYHSPSGKTEVNAVGIVASYVQGYLVPPEVNVGFR